MIPGTVNDVVPLAQRHFVEVPPSRMIPGTVNVLS